MICENAEKCNQKAICPHAIPHDYIDNPDNDCCAGCDVDGGIAESKCKYFDFRGGAKLKKLIYT